MDPAWGSFSRLILRVHVFHQCCKMFIRSLPGNSLPPLLSILCFWRYQTSQPRDEEQTCALSNSPSTARVFQLLLFPSCVIPSVPASGSSTHLGRAPARGAWQGSTTPGPSRESPCAVVRVPTSPLRDSPTGSVLLLLECTHFWRQHPSQWASACPLAAPVTTAILPANHCLRGW